MKVMSGESPITTHPVIALLPVHHPWTLDQSLGPLSQPKASTEFMLLPEGHTEHFGQWVRI